MDVSALAFISPSASFSLMYSGSSRDPDVRPYRLLGLLLSRSTQQLLPHQVIKLPVSRSIMRQLLRTPSATPSGFQPFAFALKIALPFRLCSHVGRWRWAAAGSEMNDMRAYDRGRVSQSVVSLFLLKVRQSACRLPAWTPGIKAVRRSVCPKSFRLRALYSLLRAR